MFSLSLPVFHKHTYSHTAHQWGRCDLCELRATHHFPVITGATSNPISIRHMLHKDVCVCVCVRVRLVSASAWMCVSSFYNHVCQSVFEDWDSVRVREHASGGLGWRKCVCMCACVCTCECVRSLIHSLCAVECWISSALIDLLSPGQYFNWAIAVQTHAHTLVCWVIPKDIQEYAFMQKINFYVIQSQKAQVSEVIKCTHTVWKQL